MPKPLSSMQLIGISGGSASGKSTFAQLLETQLLKHTPQSAVILSQDHYYIDQSARFTGDGESVNFDHPDAIDFALLREHLMALKMGQSIEVPHYDFATHTRSKTSTPFYSKPFVLVDGTLILASPLTRDLFDLTLFIDTPEDVRYARRLHRDTTERGRKPEGVQKQFSKQVKPMHDEFVEPSRTHAKLIFSGLSTFDLAITQTLTILQRL